MGFASCTLTGIFLKIGPFTLTLATRKQRRQVNEMVSNGTRLMSMGEVLLAYEALLGNSYANKYITKEQQVRETGLKYRGEAPKGNLLVRNILETRTAFTVRRGLSINWEGKAEQEFIAGFTSFFIFRSSKRPSDSSSFGLCLRDPCFHAHQCAGKTDRRNVWPLLACAGHAFAATTLCPGHHPEISPRGGCVRALGSGAAVASCRHS